MLGMRFSLAVLGAAFALSAAATDAEARHCRQQRHQQHYQQGHGSHQHYQGQSQCCGQGHRPQYSRHHGNSGCGYATNNHDRQDCCQQNNVNACGNTGQWHQNGGYHNQVSNCQLNGGCAVISMASASVTNVTPLEKNAPQTTVNKVVTPATFSQEPSNTQTPPAADQGLEFTK